MDKGGKRFRSLRVISPTLNFFIVMAFVGHPFLEFMKKHNWQSNALPPSLLVPLGLFFLVCLYVTVGANSYYFYRAMRNINVFTQARLLAPWTAWLMVVPVANMIAMPYVWGRTYYCSLALHPVHQVSKEKAAAMSVGAFALLLIGLAAGLMSDQQVLWPPGYDGPSLWIIGVCAGFAGAMLSTRIVQRVSAVQELYAERVGLAPPRWERTTDAISVGVVDFLKSTAFGACVGLGLFATAWPSVASSALQQLLAGLFGQVAAIEQTRPSRAQILQATADDVNKTVPQQIDPVTRLDRARVAGDQFVYEYTLNMKKLSADAISNLHRQVKSNVVPAFCTGELKWFRQSNVVVVYRYRYPDGEPVYEIAIAERDCK
jgi:hypothetical protein